MVDKDGTCTEQNCSEIQLRTELAACYRDFSRRGMDDSIYTHLSARIPESENRFLFIGFGALFREVTASKLITVNLAGETIGNSSKAVNPAGWALHKTVYEAIPDAKSIMHLHTIAGVAVSAQEKGLLPVNQFAITHWGQIAYHDYEGPGLTSEEQERLVNKIKHKKIMFLRNHGTLTWGRTIAEAYTLMHFLERTCEIQIAAQAGGGQLVIPDKKIIDRTSRIGQGTGNSTFGEIGFHAMMRQLDQKDTSYKD